MAMKTSRWTFPKRKCSALHWLLLWACLLGWGPLGGAYALRHLRKRAIENRIEQFQLEREAILEAESEQFLGSELTLNQDEQFA